jgi:opacity protein-like surface antigen
LPAAAADSHSLGGYTVGAGIEYGITPNLRAKAEYLYAHLTPTLSVRVARPATAASVPI